nr:uncharacterized protein LOC129278950 [Lytechinus pictus]
MTLRADADGRYLRVTKAILEHNHPVSKAKKKLNRHPYAMKREEVVKTEQPILPKPDNNNIAANSLHMNNRGLSNHSVPNHVLPNHGHPTQGLVNHGIANHIILDTISEAPRYPVPAPSNECHNSWSENKDASGQATDKHFQTRTYTKPWSQRSSKLSARRIPMRCVERF